MRSMSKGSVLVFCLAFAATVSAQTAPDVNNTLNPAFFAIPAGMKVSCGTSATDPKARRMCPFVFYNGITTWAYSFTDDRQSMGIVSYDPLGRIVSTLTKDGARNVYKITSDSTAQTVTFWGDGDANVVVPWALIDRQTVYTWVTATAPPAKAVLGAGGVQAPVCRGLGEYDRPWAGYWDGAHCIGSYGGNQEVVLKNLQFLTLVSGTTNWRTGAPKVIPSDIGDLPPNDINAGNTYSNYAQVLCSQAGYVGWVYSNQCSIYAPGKLSGQQNSTVLVGQVQ